MEGYRPGHKRRGVILALVVILLGGIFLGVRNYGKAHGDEKGKDELYVEQGLDDKKAESSKEEEKKPSISIPGYKDIYIKSDTEEVDVPFRNPDDNNVYFQITLKLDDGTELYKSNLIEPGKYLNNITLNEPLSKGSHNAVLSYSTYSIPDKEPRNGADINVELIAQ